MSDISMLNNHQKALSMILDEYKKETISLEFISSVHKQILSTGTYLDDITRPGIYRNDDCMVRKTDGTIKHYLYDNQIPDAMKSLVENTNKRIKNADFKSVDNHPLTIAIDLHVDFLNIHPFSDGNGRTARLLMNMVNLKFKIPPFAPKSDHENRLKYYQVFDNCDLETSNIPMVKFLGSQLIEVLSQAVKKGKL